MTPKSLAAFWQKHPEGRIETAVVNCKDGEIIVRAEVYTGKEDARPIATGHAYERDEMMAVEKALEVAGYQGQPIKDEVQPCDEQPAQKDPGSYIVKWKNFEGPISQMPPQKLLWLAANYTGKDTEAKKAAKAYLEQNPNILAKIGKSA